MILIEIYGLSHNSIMLRRFLSAILGLFKKPEYCNNIALHATETHTHGKNSHIVFLRVSGEDSAKLKEVANMLKTLKIPYDETTENEPVFHVQIFQTINIKQ